VRSGIIARAEHVQRWRLLTLVAGLWVLLRLPRMEAIAQKMYNRWHVKRPPTSLRAA
jgi:hypothetical protein